MIIWLFVCLFVFFCWIVCLVLVSLCVHVFVLLCLVFIFFFLKYHSLSKNSSRLKSHIGAETSIEEDGVKDPKEIKFYTNISCLLLEINRLVNFKAVEDHYD